MAIGSFLITGSVLRGMWDGGLPPHADGRKRVRFTASPEGCAARRVIEVPFEVDPCGYSAGMTGNTADATTRSMSEGEFEELAEATAIQLMPAAFMDRLWAPVVAPEIRRRWPGWATDSGSMTGPGW